MWKGKLIACGTNAKTIKGDGSEYLTAIMYMAPWKLAGGANLCANAEIAGCIEGCLFSAGRGQMHSVSSARIRKAREYSEDRVAFMQQLVAEIQSFVRYCEKRGIKPCVRLNGTSDVQWENIPVTLGEHTLGNIFLAFPQVQFYDYTKIANRRIENKTSGNYYLIFSYSNANPVYAKMADTAIKNGMNVAVVFRNKQQIPTEFLGLPTIDGDKDDLRFLDPKQCVVALYAKGKAKRDKTGWVQD
jgi:hypothetical protein